MIIERRYCRRCERREIKETQFMSGSVPSNIIFLPNFLPVPSAHQRSNPFLLFSISHSRRSMGIKSLYWLDATPWIAKLSPHPIFDLASFPRQSSWDFWGGKEAAEWKLTFPKALRCQPPTPKLIKIKVKAQFSLKKKLAINFSPRQKWNVCGYWS